MKKLANLTALFIFVSVNVLTPVSYAQDTPEIEDEISTVISQDEQKNGEETSSKEVLEELPVATEEQPVPVEEQPEAIPENTVPSLIDLVVDAVDNFKEEVTNPEVADPEDSNNEDLVMPSRGEITVADAPVSLGTITHDVQKGIIKLEIDNDGENREVRIKDKNEGASEITLTGEAFLLKQLMNSMCHNRNLEDESITVSELDYSAYECDSSFAAAASGLTNTAISSYAEGMAYINAHTNNSYKTYGDYYRWGNTDGYAKYEELSCKQVLAAEGLSDGCSLYVDNEARNRGFMNLSNRDNYGWYEGVYDNPCDASKGEYLPSPDDWGKLVSLWGNIKGIETEQPRSAYFGILPAYIMDFRTDLMIPNAGYVSTYNPHELSSTELSNDDINLYYANDSDYLRTSHGNFNDAGYIALNYDGAYYSSYKSNKHANPVRCFVVTNPVTVTYKYNNGDLDKVIKIQSGSWLREPEMPVRNGHTFNGWYDGDDEYYFEDEVEEDLTLTAQRTECKEGQIVKNNQCVYEVEHDKIKGILKVTDGERKIYIKDRNVGATISAGLDNVNRLYMLMDEECILDGYSDIETDRGDYYDCSPKFYEEAAKILGLPSVTDLIIEDYLDEYYYLDDENYVASFGNYYFWGNNTGSSYTGLDISRDNGTLRNASELLSIGFNGGVLENSGWVEGYYDNPCDNSKGEYLPTSDDWATVMNIRESNNPEFMDDYDDGGLREVGEYEPEYAFYGKAAAQFQQDLLIPTAGYIYKGCETAMEFGDTETDECGGLSYHYKQHDTPVITLRAGKNKHGYFGSLFGNPYSIDMYSTMDLDDNMASPVRCFVFVEPKDVKFVDGSNSWNVKVESGDSVNEPEHSQSEGRTFNGWYNGSQKWVFESPVTSNITLVAKYDTITNRVTFVSNGGSLVNPMDIEHGQSITNLPRPTKEGYNFDGWYMDEGLTQKYTNQPITQAITLYAKWSEKSSSPSNGYSGGGGSSSRPSSKGSGPSTTDVKSVDNEPSTPTKEVKIDPKPVVPSKGVNNTDKANPNQELFDAYKWAYDNGLTKYANMSDARMDDLLNRQEMAKISTIFATKFQGETPNEKKRNDCSQYPDLWKTTKDMQEFIIQSCELGYMGYRANGVDYLERFRPYTPVSVAEVSIILSRIMWQNKYAINENLWYQGHLHAVYENNLLDNITKPFDYIARKDAYIMLYRISNTL